MVLSAIKTHEDRQGWRPWRPFVELWISYFTVLILGVTISSFISLGSPFDSIDAGRIPQIVSGLFAAIAIAAAFSVFTAWRQRSSATQLHEGLAKLSFSGQALRDAEWKDDSRPTVNELADIIDARQSGSSKG